MGKPRPTSVIPKTHSAVLEEISLRSLTIQSSVSLFSALRKALVDINRDGLRSEITYFFPSLQPVQQCSPVYMTHKCSLLMVVSSLPPAEQFIAV